MANARESSDLRIRQIQLSLYDRVSAWLWSLTMIFSVLTVFSVMMWLQMARHQAKIADEMISVVPIPTNIGLPGDPRPKGFGEDEEDPGIEEFYETEVSQLADAVEAVTDLPSRIRGLLGAVDGDAELMGKGRGLGHKDGEGGGGGGAAERWSVEYETENIGKYADQLSAFGIEIGFVSKVTDQVDVLFNLNSTPQKRTTTRDEEKRSYFIHVNSKLRSWDMRLGVNAGVKPEGKIMVQFYPPAIMETLGKLEAVDAQNRGLVVTKVRRTIFKVRPVGNSYEYFVAGMIPK